MEITRWKVMFQLLPPEDRPDTLAKTMKECDQQRFPNLIVLLRIACTLPVTSCECERSASALRRLMTPCGHRWEQSDKPTLPSYTSTMSRSAENRPERSGAHLCKAPSMATAASVDHQARTRRAVSVKVKCVKPMVLIWSSLCLALLQH